MTRTLVLACAILSFAAPAGSTRQGVPIVDLPAASARSRETFGALLGIRQTSNGNVLVNDVGRRQMKLFDSTFALLSVPMDSTPGFANSYGRRAPLLRYTGDSSLSADLDAGTLLVLGPSGQVARAIAPPTAHLPRALMQGFAGIDDKGRILFKARANFGPPTPRPDGTLGPAPGAVWDSATVFRADFDLRRVDTLGSVKVEVPFTMYGGEGAPMKFRVEPAPVVDEWAVLSGGGGGRSGGRGAGSGADPTLPQTARPVVYVPPALNEIADYYPSLRSGAVIPDLDGNLWILPTSSAQSRNGELVYDVVNVRGDFHRVRVPLGRSIAGFGRGGVVYLQSGDKATGFSLERVTLGKSDAAKK